MINLIPPSAQAQVTREYWIRVVSVWLFLIGAAVASTAVLYIPSYVLVQSQLASIQAEYTNAASYQQSLSAAEATITHANTIAELLVKTQSATTFTDIINELQKETGDGIMIFDFDLKRTGAVINSITITGQASSRAALSQFRDVLDANPTFGNVELPFSSLAKDKEVPFTITITPDKAKSS